MIGGTHSVTLLFAGTFLFWQITNYLLSVDPIRKGRHTRLTRNASKRLAWLILRSACAGVLTGTAAGWGAGAGLAAAMFAGCTLLPVARWLWVPSRYVAELEIGSNLAFVALAQVLIAHFDLHARFQLAGMPVAEGRIVAYTLTAALLIFVVRGGTYIVRGVLDRAGTMPLPDAVAGTGPQLQRALPIDVVELNHGRLIGNIERLILVLFVANDQFTALAFFFAAKGLIRSKDVERRAWADYLILGSLTSFLVAVVIGLLIQAAFRGV